MDIGVLAKRIETELGADAEKVSAPRTKRIYVDVPASKSVRANRYLFDKLGGRLATATGVDTRDAVEILYHWALDDEGVVVTVRTRAEKPALKIEAVSSFLPAAEWIEREIMDLFGVTFKNHPRPERLLLSDDWPQGVYPYRRDQEK